jgi:ABC-type transporter Mla subunit MlaD
MANQRTININIQGDSSDAQNAIADAQRQLNDLSRERMRNIDVTIDVNAGNVDAQIDRARRRLEALQNDLDDTGTDAGSSFMGGFNRGVAQALGGAIPQLQGALGNLGSSGGPIGLAIAGGIVVSAAAAITAAAPILSSALIGGLSLGLAGASLAVGIKFAINAPEVQAEVENLGTTFQAVMEQATYPLRGPLMEAMQTFGDMLREIGPQLRQVFEALAPAVEPFATAMADLVVNAMPGFVSLIQTVSPMIAQLAPLLPPIGTALSQMMAEFAKSPEAQQQVMGLLALTLQFLPQLITWLGSTVVRLAEFGQAVAQKSEQAISAFNSLKTGASTAFNLMSAAVGSAGKAVQMAMSMAGQAVDRARAAITSALSGVVSSATSSSSRFVSSITSGFNSAVSAASSFGSRILSIITGLGSRFFSAGAQIISQLTSGITSRIQGAINAVSGLARRLAGFLPGSPVDEGPLRVLNRGYAGGQIVQMLADGIEAKGALPQAALTEALPSPFAAAGGRRGGGGVVINIDLSGAVVDRARFLAELRQEIASGWGGRVDLALGG